MKIALLWLLCLAVQSPGHKLPHIIGGSPVTDATKWPWQGSLRVFGLHNCGCSLISSTWTVTAAHCSGYSPLFYDIRFGSVDRDNGGIIAVPDNIIVHEEWDEGPGSFPNDIALMHFSPVELGSTVKVVAMATSEQAGNPNCYITGWGWMTTGEEGHFPAELHEAHVEVYSQSVCKGYHGSSINAGHVCVGDQKNGRGSCKGDSGGPLVCATGGKYELVGVSSWAVSGCYTNKPAVYTRVAFFRDWVKKHTHV